MEPINQLDDLEATGIAARLSAQDIAEGLKSRDKRTAQLSRLALRKCGPEAADVLIASFYESAKPPVGEAAQRRAAKALTAGGSVLVVGLLLSGALPKPLSTIFSFGLIVVVMSRVTIHFQVPHKQRYVLSALAELQDKRVVGVLIDSLAMHSALKPEVYAGLARLLPALTSEDADLVTADRLRVLASHLRGADEALGIAILHAIELFGNGTFVTPLNELRKHIGVIGFLQTSPPWLSLVDYPEVRSAFERCLAVEQDRLDARQNLDTLLRSSGGVVETDSLLRAATATAASDPFAASSI